MDDDEHIKQSGFVSKAIASVRYKTKGYILLGKIVGFIAIIGCVAHFSWTANMELERAALKDVVVIPLEYKRTMMTFESLGYKIVLERITKGDGKDTIARIVYAEDLLAQQKATIRRAVALKSSHIAKQEAALAELEAEKRVLKVAELKEDIAEVLEIDNEDRDSLNDTLSHLMKK